MCLRCGFCCLLLGLLFVECSAYIMFLYYSRSLRSTPYSSNLAVGLCALGCVDIYLLVRRRCVPVGSTSRDVHTTSVVSFFFFRGPFGSQEKNVRRKKQRIIFIILLKFFGTGGKIEKFPSKNENIMPPRLSIELQVFSKLITRQHSALALP